ncbi:MULTISPECIES: glycoside hydrolase family 3 protein [unclassified Enterococcus]|uniref:glycoside hydrolase family 3 protein n=1 Tax=unclassified Enterococcus TaxID=2608891 RepID=UPI001CE163C0|nr:MULTISPECIES: glycoside hydrolase family 3 N-terminal domain-containing protein [unclassified Enterococcus]MCA5013011.1 beta-hexosaminidase [Enterococcus sp. S23]MCA5016262.1 beta-hexosaminidase [Enterococcus sp. S22(2020)]
MNQKEQKETSQRSETTLASSTTTSSTQKRTSAKTQDEAIKKLMASMSLEEKVGQLFLARVPVEGQIESIQLNHLGGYLLFGRDVEMETPETLKEKIASYQEASKIPLLIASDEEGGTVSRLSRGTDLVADAFQSPQEIYQASGLTGIRRDIQQKATVLHSYGIQAGLFPDADVATDPQAFIYDRTLGLDADKTSEYIKTSVEELKNQKLVSTLKHFPGYGNNRDSHVEIVYDTRTLAELQTNDFLPFKAGILAGADSVLVSHNIVTSIDETMPASISKPVHDLLRNELGFQGVIMTDDMDMAGLAEFIPQEEAGLAALQAGNDLILSSSFQEQIPYVLQGIEQGVYTTEALDQSVYRVLKMKMDIGLINR